MSTLTVQVRECNDEAELFRRYGGQSEAQPAYIELDLREGTLSASYDSEIGNAVPFSVHHGFERRYYIPVLTATAANRVMHEIAPLADRILSDWAAEWDGNNTVAHLGEDAEQAEAEIEQRLGSDYERSWAQSSAPFDESDLIAEWDLDGATNGHEAEEYQITAETSDDRLGQIESEILRALAECSTPPRDPAAVRCPDLSRYLRDLRDQMTDEDD